MARKFVVSTRLETEDRSSRVVEENERAWKGLSSTWLRVSAVAAGIGATFVGIVSALRQGAAAAFEQERSIASLRAALEGLEDASEGTAEALIAQADALQQTSRFSNEAVLEAQALLATFGVQADQLGTATQAAVDLAAAFNIDLVSAARNVGRTVGGFAGELGEVIPELKDLSAEALRSGEGIDFLAERFSGRALADAQTFAGAVTQLSNALDDFNKVLAQSVTNNEEAGKSVSNFARSIGVLNEELARSEGFGGRVVTFFSDVGALAATLAANFFSASQSTQALARAQGDLADSGEDAVSAQRKLNDSLFDAATAADAARIAEENLVEVRNELFSDAGITTLEETAAALDDERARLELNEEAYRQGSISRAQFAQNTAEIEEEIRALEAVLRGEVATVQDYKRAVEEATQANDVWSDSIDTGVGSLEAQTRALDSATAAQGRLNQAKREDPEFAENVTGGRSEFATIGGGSFTTTIPRDSGRPRLGLRLNIDPRFTV